MVEAAPDRTILRELAKRYVDLCAQPKFAERRDLWRRHNSLQPTRPLIYVRGGRMWDEIPQRADLKCRDRFHHPYERFFREMLYRDRFDDDSVFEPWVTVRAAFACAGWGVDVPRRRTEEAHGSFKLDYPLKKPEDLARLRPAHHLIDEAATALALQRARDAVGDILPVVVDRSPAYLSFGGDLSTNLGFLRGIENFMLDMMDRPAWLGQLVAFLRDGVLRAHDEADAAGDWSVLAHQNQAMPYACELPDPAPDSAPVGRKRLWGFMAAQEFALVSPAMHEEFLLRYQIPILEKFGLTAYGCCEDLTRKIDLLRKIPNLRRIAVTPWADVRKCAEQIGTDYVISWRPSPAEAVCCGFDADRVRRTVREALAACRGLHVDITLKDIDTVQGRPERLTDWVRTVRETIDERA